jgi:hypothetical protein
MGILQQKTAGTAGIFAAIGVAMLIAGCMALVVRPGSMHPA